MTNYSFIAVTTQKALFFFLKRDCEILIHNWKCLTHFKPHFAAGKALNLIQPFLKYKLSSKEKLSLLVPIHFFGCQLWNFLGTSREHSIAVFCRCRFCFLLYSHHLSERVFALTLREFIFQPIFVEYWSFCPKEVRRKSFVLKIN